MLQLKKLRKSRGISLKSLSDKLGVSISTISLYENEKREASYSMLLKLSNYFSVSIDYLLGNTDIDDNYPDGYCCIRVPVLDAVSFSEKNMEFEFSAEKEAILYGNPDECFYFRVHGDFMAPEINDGDLALVRKQSDVESGNVAAVISESKPVMLKKVIKNKDTTVLQPLNPKYESIFVSESTSIVILGKVIQIIRKYR